MQPAVCLSFTGNDTPGPVTDRAETGGIKLIYKTCFYRETFIYTLERRGIILY